MTLKGPGGSLYCGFNGAVGSVVDAMARIDRRGGARVHAQRVKQYKEEMDATGMHD